MEAPPRSSSSRPAQSCSSCIRLLSLSTLFVIELTFAIHFSLTGSQTRHNDNRTIRCQTRRSFSFKNPRHLSSFMAPLTQLLLRPLSVHHISLFPLIFLVWMANAHSLLFQRRPSSPLRDGGLLSEEMCTFSPTIPAQKLFFEVERVKALRAPSSDQSRIFISSSGPFPESQNGRIFITRNSV